MIYSDIVETMRFLLLDKTKRPFLFLKDSKFGGPVTSRGTTWMHSVSILIQNISYEQAKCVRGYAGPYVDDEFVKPSFFTGEFTVASVATHEWTVPVSEETFDCGTSGRHKLKLYVHFEYDGIRSDPGYHARLWSTFDPNGGTFIETFTDSKSQRRGVSVLSPIGKQVEP